MGGAVAEQMDFTREADGCFRLAESETHAEVRTILMGMGYGWLTLANHQKASSEAHHEPIEEPTDEPADDLVSRNATRLGIWLDQQANRISGHRRDIRTVVALGDRGDDG